MSAGRSASSLLFTLIATIVLFAVFAGVSSLNSLEEHAYMPEAGWNEPAGYVSNLHDVCASTKQGFPLANSRSAETPVSCLQATNPTAQAMNYAMYFTVAGIISVGLVESMRSRLP